MSRVALLSLLLVSLSAQAQKPSDSYLRLTEADGQGVSGRWDVSLQDLDDVLGLDAGGDGAITWGEVLAREADIRSYVLGRLVLGSEGAPCALVSQGGLHIRQHSDGAYAVVDFDARCTGSAARLDVDYTLLFDHDPLHRGIVRVGAREPLIFSVSQHFARVHLRDESPWRTAERMTVEGALHVVTRPDHLLFLFALLLPSVLRRDVDGRWVAVSGFGTALWDVVKVVSAFTVAHALTLVAATLGWASLPPRFVSIAFALGILVAALDNVRPLGWGTRWTVAFVLGLLHGFGFASVLAGMGLSAGSLALALLGFNLGVELGQVAFVAALLPLAFVLRKAPLYRRAVVVGGSVAIALLACLWLAERALGLGVSVT
ncbi:putative membrane protein [Myxococcus xanthus DK 1622]|uniref:Membrane protein n=2 Tax=Myxococcus xanthus TaxID=34 RepID=Q1CX99_MYXXD|nr:MULTISPECIES: HupE/UreJ family protein [Myxococcus]AAO22900.1 putative membrane protein [Myxococcus xanthus]ABF86438.1 putative membrane protein [Myxococcus xanthus DK 1622]NOJ51278.1 HupE/UreJ family protein [Myxococcus xanthus]QPM79153.1 HupE/UreJ family protein [Myxococcus xanthus]QVW68231.1 HupE/UreJ family protein [Myxococcus xanthus DZ2]